MDSLKDKSVSYCISIELECTEMDNFDFGWKMVVIDLPDHNS